MIFYTDTEKSESGYRIRIGSQDTAGFLHVEQRDCVILCLVAGKQGNDRVGM